MVPPVICFHVQRLLHLGRQVRVGTHVSFPLLFDAALLSTYKIPTKDGDTVESVDNSGPGASTGASTGKGVGNGHAPGRLYRLRSVIVHSGSASAGHYTAFALCAIPTPPNSSDSGSEEQWYYFNDNQPPVSVSSDDVQRATAYMLFYERDD